MNQTHYDFIIAGAGAAGLSLAYHLNKQGFRDKTILIVDQSEKQEDDRTWCFWAKDAGSFAPVVLKSWDNIWFKSPQFSKQIPLSPYKYFMLRGIDFYDFIIEDLRKNPNINIKLGAKAQNIRNGNGYASIQIDQQTYTGTWLFDSFYKYPSQIKPGYHYFKQHFKGLLIQTQSPKFDDSTATFMDFTIAQKGEARFFYILPLTPRQALVEFTIFSECLLSQKEYDIALEEYLRDTLKIDEYKIIKEEFGIIPMVDEAPVQRKGDHILNIGTKGGYTKASSGFSFNNIQKNTAAIIHSLKHKGHPFDIPKPSRRFQLYDSMLLRVMQEANPETRQLFAIMFQKHPVERVLRFLDEESHFGEELLIMAKMPPFPFLKALRKITYERSIQILRKNQILKN